MPPPDLTQEVASCTAFASLSPRALSTVSLGATTEGNAVLVTKSSLRENGVLDAQMQVRVHARTRDVFKKKSRFFLYPTAAMNLDK